MEWSPLRRIKYDTKRKIAGWLFILPWVFGALVFFIQPLIMTIYYSFVKVAINPEAGGLIYQSLENGVFQNYVEAFTRDPNYVWYYRNVLIPMMGSIPAILVFSLFIANILSKPFRGRTFMRAIFFLPVIITSGVVISVMKNNLSTTSLTEATATISLFDTSRLMEVLLQSGMPRTIVDYVSTLVSGVMDLIWKSGVQILIFMAGILAIPSTYYEVGAAEGATSWEAFWKITFPLIIPHMMINLIYSMVELLASYDNNMMVYIIDVIYTKIQFSYGSALAWIYFLVISVFIGILLLILTRINRRYKV